MPIKMPPKSSAIGSVLTLTTTGKCTQKYCTTCGASGKLEIHHVAGRKYSPVTTLLCRPCHVYCTLAGYYERRWLIADPLFRLWAGVLDVWNRFADCNDLPRVIDALYSGEFQGFWDYRPCSAIAAAVGQESPNTLQYQGAEILRLVGEVVQYVFQS